MAVTGSYRVSAEMMGNKAEGTMTLRARGSQLEGTVRGLGMDADLQDGAVSGDTFTGIVEGPTPLGQMRFKVKGTVSGDKVEGTLKAGLMTVKFAGTRITL